MSKKMCCLIYVILLQILVLPAAHAAIQTHSFTITGSNGESGSGSFTWDDTVVANGNPLSLGDIISLTMTISGGNIVGSPTTYSLTDCMGATLENTPDFTASLNWNCYNGQNQLAAQGAFSNELNFGASSITFAAGTTSSAAPATPAALPVNTWWALIALAISMILVVMRKSRFSGIQNP
ncbi:hypothetical protein [Gilvimarinus chinensis]|uniref:hypothetical protein n=1 Tax=Gilvimarinus chinensis TaxID=396005 RepID=UPI000370BDFD|nr:hypothetical protein [Gilvimarinus chinensis]